MFRHKYFFWVTLACTSLLGASLVMIGLAGAVDEGDDVLELPVDPDAADFDPYVVYEWAARGSSCGVGPELVAALGHVASNDGDIDGYEFDTHGTTKPALYGESGDGSRANLATIYDTDFGAIDDDRFWDRPVGPFQLLPISWHRYGLDGNRDGVEDPQNLWDASASAANFLCAMGAGPSGDDIEAVRKYTGSERLSNEVLERYDELLADSSPFEQTLPLREDPDPVEQEGDAENGEDHEDADNDEDAEDADNEDLARLLGDWNSDGVQTGLVWDIRGSNFMWMSPVLTAIPLDADGRPYGARVRVEVSPGAVALVGDWNENGYESIAVRHKLNDDTDVVEFYDRFGNVEGDVVTIDEDDGIDEIWIALRGPEESEQTLAFSGEGGEAVDIADADSIVASNGEEIELVRVEGILVNETLAEPLAQMIEHARADGLKLDGWGWRSNQRQIELRIANCADPFETPSSECTPPTARPGHSRHERGLAIDFHIDGRVLTRLDTEFIWLEQNAATYGLFNLPSEPWHWSVDGR